MDDAQDPFEQECNVEVEFEWRNGRREQVTSLNLKKHEEFQ